MSEHVKPVVSNSFRQHEVAKVQMVDAFLVDRKGIAVLHLIYRVLTIPGHLSCNCASTWAEV